MLSMHNLTKTTLNKVDLFLNKHTLMVHRLNCMGCARTKHKYMQSDGTTSKGYLYQK